MPTLFISYKRNSDGIQKLLQKLRDARYALWFDRDDIHLGDPDWEAKIVQGIQACDGVVLCLTPAACESKAIRFEMETAQAFAKPIFPVMLEALDDDIASCLNALSISEKQHVEPLYGVDDWDEQFQRLLRGLKAHGLLVTAHDIRKDRSAKEFTLHKQYLSKLIMQIGRLQLSAINPDTSDAEGAALETIYVPLPTKEAISIEVKEYRIVDWWLDELGSDKSVYNLGISRTKTYPEIERTRPEQKGWHDRASLASLVDGRQMQLDQQYESDKDRDPVERRYLRDGDGVRDADIPLLAHDIAAATHRLVVLGKPGSGKSTFVKHLALCMAGEGRENWMREATIDTIGRWSHGFLTPIYIELRAFVSWEHFPQNLDEKPNSAHLWAYIKSQILGDELADYGEQLAYDLENGHALLILDGLDEVPYPRKRGALQARQEQLKALVQSLNDSYGQTRIVVASRSYVYEGWTLPQFSSVALAAFSDGERQHLASNLYRAAGDSDALAQAKAQRLNQALQAISPELKDRPLFVTMMANIFARGEEEGLPTRKGALYYESILLLLERWTKAKPNAQILTDLLGDSNRDDLLSRLAEMAYDVHEQLGDTLGTAEIPRGLLAKHMLEMEWEDPSLRATQIVSYLSENAGILVSPGHAKGDPVFQFAHRSFQEYLAARHILASCTDSFDMLRGLMLKRPQLWRIPARLVADVLVDDSNFRDKDLWGLVDNLLAKNVPSEIEADDADLWLVWLCSRYVIEQDLPEASGRMLGVAKENLIAWLLLVMRTEQGLAPIERADCGRALSILDDPREGVGLRADGLPDIAWGKEVPAGTYMTGGDEKAYQPLPEQEVSFGYSYKLAKYPVTMAQFEAFMKSENGFQADKWWHGFPEKEDTYGSELVVREMQAQAFQYDNHPRDTVSWYQALAFCRWLTEKYHKAGLLDAHSEIRLPTEQEWQAAAGYPDGHAYAYEGAADSSKMNVAETQIGQTSAVGLFPSGRNLQLDLYDLNGNVWEWCLSKYKDSSPMIDDSGERRVLRGGSWFRSTTLARSASRNYNNPYDWYYNNGFRLCVAPVQALVSDNSDL